MHQHQAQPRHDVGAPPPHAVEWRVSSGKRSVRVSAQLWLEARRLGALELGVVPDLCKCVRLDEVRLVGKGRA